MSDAVSAVTAAMNRIGVPASIHGNFQGTARAFQQSLANEPYLILAALIAVYVVLGILYESYMHPLTILAVGLYGETLANQNGAPIRLVVPWKYGFKGVKSIVRITLTEKQPPCTWNVQNPREYGFYSNVNPNVDHPRWSQATERRIGEGGLFVKRRPTLMFNGYGEQVASLYSGLDLKANY